jgi:hypothetical protein
MMRSKRILLGLSVLTLLLRVDANAQARPAAGSDFPAAQFDSLDKIAHYLWQYDSFAWHTSDKLAAEVNSLGKEVVDRLGEEWFCVRHDGMWHGVYGKFDGATDKYHAAVHYVDAGAGITRSATPFNPELANRLGRALFTAKQHIPPAFNNARMRFNSYVREREDHDIDVWFVPAWQSNGWLLYGSEFQYTLDAEGRTVKDSVVRLGNIMGMRPDSTESVMLRHDDAPGIPTVAEILFMRLYSKYFAHVRVRTRDWVSEFLSMGAQRAWVHALRSGG